MNSSVDTFLLREGYDFSFTKHDVLLFPHNPISCKASLYLRIPSIIIRE